MGLITTRGPAYGRADVYLDGKRVATLDLRVAGANRYRELAWHRTFGTAAKHTVQVVGLGTAGRPGVAVDGIAYLR